jgi:hypothetical protein
VPGSDDDAFCTQGADRLVALPGVLAISLGGSRAASTARPDSDRIPRSIYRADSFHPASLRTFGWLGEVFPIGGWGGGVLNGGAWLRAGCRGVDVHYRDLDGVGHPLAQALGEKVRY